MEIEIVSYIMLTIKVSVKYVMNNRIEQFNTYLIVISFQNIPNVPTE